MKKKTTILLSICIAMICSTLLFSTCADKIKGYQKEDMKANHLRVGQYISQIQIIVWINSEKWNGDINLYTKGVEIIADGGEERFYTTYDEVKGGFLVKDHSGNKFTFQDITAPSGRRVIVFSSIDTGVTWEYTVNDIKPPGIQPKPRRQVRPRKKSGPVYKSISE